MVKEARYDFATMFKLKPDLTSNITNRTTFNLFTGKYDQIFEDFAKYNGKITSANYLLQARAKMKQCKFQGNFQTPLEPFCISDISFRRLWNPVHCFQGRQKKCIALSKPGHLSGILAAVSRGHWKAHQLPGIWQVKRRGLLSQRPLQVFHGPGTRGQWHNKGDQVFRAFRRAILDKSCILSIDRYDDWIRNLFGINTISCV